MEPGVRYATLRADVPIGDFSHFRSSGGLGIRDFLLSPCSIKLHQRVGLSERAGATHFEVRMTGQMLMAGDTLHPHACYLPRLRLLFRLTHRSAPPVEWQPIPLLLR